MAPTSLTRGREIGRKDRQITQREKEENDKHSVKLFGAAVTGCLRLGRLSKTKVQSYTSGGWNFQFCAVSSDGEWQKGHSMWRECRSHCTASDRILLAANVG